MSDRYVEYLERYPARISAPALRRLAAALQTSPGALLGAGLDTAPGRCHPSGHRTLARLTRTKCYKMIESGGVGRIAFPAASGTLVLPVNFAVSAGTIVIRTSPAGIIAAHAGDPVVTFEVDHIDDALQQGWSVLIRGTPRMVTDHEELLSLQQDAVIGPWPDGTRDAYVRISPTRISGRQIIELAG